MKIDLGVKTDCIETRYSFDWLFDILADEGIQFVQLGSFYEMYHLDLSYFRDLRKKAESRGIRIKSVFTAHRELGGFFVGDQRMEAAARKGFERLLEIAEVVGADYAGSNPGAIYRDHPIGQKETGTLVYLKNLQCLSRTAKKRGLKGLTMEPMSCLAEPPTTPEEMEFFISKMNADHFSDVSSTVPTYLCGDISHGYCDLNKNVIQSNEALFKAGISMMAEFHFKNTDTHFNSTFGFNPDERAKGIVDLHRLKRIVEEHENMWPVSEVVGYLEIMGPKIGRDYSDRHLEKELRSSLSAIKSVFRD